MLRPVIIMPILVVRPSDEAFEGERVSDGRDRSEAGPEAEARHSKRISPWEGLRETEPASYRGSQTGSRGAPSLRGSQHSSEPLQGRMKTFPVSETSGSSTLGLGSEPRSSHGRPSFSPKLCISQANG